MHTLISLGTKFQFKPTTLIFWAKFDQRKYFRSKMEKLKITIEFCILKLVLLLHFNLNWQFWFFGPNLPKKFYLRSKKENLNITVELCIFKLVSVPHFSLIWQFGFFGPNLPKTGISCLKKKKWNHHWILHFRIGLASKFGLKGYFWSKTEKSHFRVRLWSLRTILNPHEGRQIQRCVNVSSPSSRRES